MRLQLSVLAYNPGEPVAAAGDAEEDRSLVADQLAAAAGEDGWPIGEARPLLLAAVSGRASDPASVRGNSAADLGATPADWIGRGCGEENRLTEGGWDGEVSEKSLAMGTCGLFLPRGGGSGPFPGLAESLGMENIQEAGASGGG